MGKPVNGIAKIEKKFTLTTAGKEGGAPVFEQTGEGTIQFDLKAGVPHAVDMQLLMKVNRENVTLKIPTTISARLLTPAELAKLDEEAKTAAAASAAAAAEAARPMAIDDATLDQLLTDLQAQNGFKVRGTLETLAKAIVIEARRAEVAGAIEPLLKDRDGFIQVAAAKALGVWGTADTVPVLLGLLDHQNVFLKGAAVESPGLLKDERAAAALAERVPQFFERQAASNALKTMGPIAEKPVLPLLKHSDWTVQLAACQILAAVGSKASQAPLDRLAKTDKGAVGKEAEKALEAISKRQNQ